MMKFTGLVLACMVAYVSADCYMQNPRGSNDRLNGQAANRANGNRLFDSQNNNRGGYNACDKGTNAAANNANNLYYKSADRDGANPDAIYGENTNRNEAVQYPMMYYAGSQLQMEWTVQHGCGGNEASDPTKLNCNMVIQYMCDQDVKGTNGNQDYPMTVYLADGLNTNAPDSTGANGGNNCNTATTVTVNNINNRMDANDAAARGRHESEGFYCECQQRNRNKGLFVADQDLNGNVAQYTRQNPNGGRRGLECPQERDYYPYEGPTPFRDMAYLTDDMARCAMIQTQSQNVAAKGKCTTGTGAMTRNVVQNIDEADCISDGGIWESFSYGIPPPACQQAGYSRVNHLGNGRGDGVSPETLGYNATIPDWNVLTTGKVPVVQYGNNEYAKCVMRLRYNVSTDDYDPWTTNYKANGDASPVTQNPNVAVGASAKLQLALNTNQYGRTFQDRSHVFFIKKPSAQVATAMSAGARIINLNVRGKRGNIVQTYPATEYDFVPTNAAAAPDDMVHLQYCGSNTHNNGNPGGDGQTGDAGEGTGGTDRQNLAQMKDFDDNFPVPFEKMAQLGVPSLFDNDCYSATTGGTTAPGSGTSAGVGIDCALRVATSGYIRNQAQAANRNMNPTLDNTPASTVGAGTFFAIKAEVGTTYRYMGTRNNNFTNRGMKGELTIEPKRGAAPVAPTPPAGGR